MSRKIKLLISALAIASFVFGLASLSPKPSSAQGVVKLRGWAWSSNIGWVSMNCADQSVCGTSNYKVSVDSGTGNLSGYAWSSNIGWIRFDPAGPYPENPQNSARIDNLGSASSPLSGWARALSNNVGNGRWDGWIKMSDVSISGSQFSGFAWGSDVIGWLNFDSVTRGGGGAPACPIFTADPNTIVVAGPGGSGTTTLSWQCVNVNPGTCSIDQGIGPVLDSGSTQTTLSYTTTYILSCEGGGGATATTYVKVRVFTPQRIEVRP